jgi:F-type H+-transporting ATPase subunit delta
LIVEPAARRYAEAAYLIAREESKENEWLDGLQTVASAFGDAHAKRVFQSSRVSAQQKRDLVRRLLEGVEPKVVSLALLLLRRGRTSLGPQASQAYQEILDRERGIAHALVTTAVPMDSDELEAVQRKLVDITDGPVVVRTEVNEEILGGMVVRIGDRLIDGSTRSRLLALKQRLAGVSR